MLVVIRLIVRILTRALPAVPWVRTLERSISWIAWIVAVLWLTDVLPSVLEEMDEVKWKIGATKISLRNLVEGTITAGVVLMLALWVSAVLERRLLANASGQDLSWRKIVATLLRTVLLFIGLMFALSAVGIDLTALSVLGGGLAVGLGFGLQKIAANYVSGFVILAERSISIGDMVKVDNFEGQVSDIRTRYTVIRALNGREAIIPNETLITTRVENSSLADRSVLMQTTLSVAYGTDVRKLQPMLQGAVAAVPRVLDKPAPSVQMSAFTASSIELTVNFWIADPEAGQGNVKSEVNLAVLDVLRAERRRLSFGAANGVGDHVEGCGGRPPRRSILRRPRAPHLRQPPTRPRPEGSETASRRVPRLWQTRPMRTILLALALIAAVTGDGADPRPSRGQHPAQRPGGHRGGDAGGRAAGEPAADAAAALPRRQGRDHAPGHALQAGNGPARRCRPGLGTRGHRSEPA